MKPTFRQIAVALAWLTVLAALPGCGDGKVKVKGKLTKGGQPYTVANETLVTLRFSPDVEKPDQTYVAKFKQETGEFEVQLPAGKYRAGVVIVEKNTKLVPVPPDVSKTVHEMTAGKELNIEIGAK